MKFSFLRIAKSTKISYCGPSSILMNAKPVSLNRFLASFKRGYIILSQSVWKLLEASLLKLIFMSALDLPRQLQIVLNVVPEIVG